MPIYEYRCDNCEHEFETIRKFSDEPLKTCPVCHQDTLRKQVSVSAFRLKGGGWYETDFKSGDKKRNIGGDSETTTTPPAAAKPVGSGSDGAKSSDSSSSSAGSGATSTSNSTSSSSPSSSSSKKGSGGDAA
jgi:putative FmdB family regulatory protein